MPTFTDIYRIDEEGEISFHASYSLPKEEALKCAVIQLSKRFDTWNYHRFFVPLKAYKNNFYFHYGKNNVLFTWDETYTSSA